MSMNSLCCYDVMAFFFLITCPLDNILMLYGKITCDHILGLNKTHLESENELR